MGGFGRVYRVFLGSEILLNCAMSKLVKFKVQTMSFLMGDSSGVEGEADMSDCAAFSGVWGGLFSSTRHKGLTNYLRMIWKKGQHGMPLLSPMAVWARNQEERRRKGRREGWN